MTNNISFSCGWEQGIVGANNWYKIQSQDDATRFTLVTNPVRRGTHAARVEVRAGDINSSGERSEVSLMKDAASNNIWENEASGTKYYTFSIFLPLDWTPPPLRLDWGVVFQCHAPDRFPTSPSFCINVTDRFTVHREVGDLDITPVNVVHNLLDQSLNLGNWTDWVVKIKWTRDLTGEVQVWRRNNSTLPFTNVLSLPNVCTLEYKTSEGAANADHYWKVGYYRAPQTSSVSVLYNDCITRGETFEDVVREAYGDNMNATIPLTGISSGNVPTTPIAITAVATDPALFDGVVVNYSDPGATGNIVLTPKPGAAGTTTITVTVDNHQPANNKTSKTFTVTMKKLNPPVIDPIADVTLYS